MRTFRVIVDAKGLPVGGSIEARLERAEDQMERVLWRSLFGSEDGRVVLTDRYGTPQSEPKRREFSGLSAVLDSVERFG